MTEKQIQNRLDKARTKGENEIGVVRSEFYNRPYGEPLPDNFMKLFEKSLFLMAPMIDNLSSDVLGEWFKMELKDLSFGRVGKMAEIIAMSPRYMMFENMEEAISSLMPVEKALFDVRERKAAFEFEIQKKKDKLNEKLQRMKFSLQNMTGTVKDSKSKMAVAQ